jgi:hypothetical protein
MTPPSRRPSRYVKSTANEAITASTIRASSPLTPPVTS